jgi:hypothetical protein
MSHPSVPGKFTAGREWVLLDGGNKPGPRSGNVEQVTLGGTTRQLILPSRVRLDSEVTRLRKYVYD